MEFYSHIVVTSQSMNKKIWDSHPVLLCLHSSKCPTLLKQLWIFGDWPGWLLWQKQNKFRSNDWQTLLSRSMEHSMLNYFFSLSRAVVASCRNRLDCFAMDLANALGRKKEVWVKQRCYSPRVSAAFS